MVLKTGNYKPAPLTPAEITYLQQLYWNQQAGQYPSAYTWAVSGRGIVQATPNWVVAARAGFVGSGQPTSTQQIYNEVIRQGGSVLQAQVTAALTGGPESSIGGGYGRPQTTELSGGRGPAEGLFQFEPGTWTGGAGGGRNGLPGTVGAASWQQQVTGFINASGGPGGQNFGAWGPDLGGPYGYVGPPRPGSKVANLIASQGFTGATAAGSASGLLNPIGPGLTRGRVDQGVDWSGSGPLFAVGAGTIVSVTNPGWPGGTFIALKLDNPVDAQHSIVYYAEDITPNVKMGQHVDAGHQVGTATGGSTGIELGWGNPAAIGQALGHGDFTGNNATPAGNDFLSAISGGSMATSSTLTASDWQAIKTASNQPGGAEYLAAAHNAAAQTTGAAAGSPSGTLADVLSSVLGPWGLDTPVVHAWVTQQITLLASMNMSTAQIGEQIGIMLQEPPGSSKDSLTTQAQQQFAAKYPGMQIRRQNGLPPITVAQYQDLERSYYQSASAVGITPTMLNGLALEGGSPGNAVGLLVGNDVSPTELTSRLQNGYNAAVNANPETVRLLQRYYPSVFPQGVHGGAPTNGALLSYYLDPKNTVSMLQNQITAAQIGTEGVNSEFGGIPVAQAQKLQQAGVTQQTARDTFKNIAKLTPFEQKLPGVPAQGTVMTQQQLIDYGFFGANQQELENIQSARKAPFTGGGGYATTAKGVVGAGGASTEGQQGT